jgi:Glycosyl hydrolase family 30 beta sandwich domain
MQFYRPQKVLARDCGRLTCRLSVLASFLRGIRHGRPGVFRLLVVSVLVVLTSEPLRGQTVNATATLANGIATVPAYGMGIHTSVYDNSLQYTGSPTYDLLDSRLDAAGVNVLRYPGGGYADIFHFSTTKSIYDGGTMTGSGTTPWWGQEGNYGYVAPKTDFGSFVKLLDATNSQTVITVNTGGAMKYNSFTQLGVPTHGGQPQEAAAWVAYANADASIYGTPQDISLGIDAEGNDWKTAGYWAKLRASTSAEYSSWASTAGVYDSRNAFLAIDRDQPVGVKYWEIGNETFGAGYYGGGTGYALNYAVPYDGTDRDDNANLSPAAYGAQVNQFVAAMKAVDPTIKTGAVLATPPDDYSWSYADQNDDGIKQSNEPYWNDVVLSHSDPGLGRVANNVDFVIVHWYPSGNNSTILSDPRVKIPQMINGTTSGLDSGSNAGLRDSIATWRSDNDPNALEIFVTETDGGGNSETVDGLFAADEYATFFENGVSNVDYLELHNGQFLQESSNDPNFAYFGMQAVHLMAEPGDELVATTTSQDAVRIHAAQRSDGSVAVMVINTNTSSRTVNVSIDGGMLSEDGVMYQTNGDTALSLTNLSDLGNSFSTSIAGRTLQLFVLPALAGLPGDYNGNGTIDAADYAVWRDAVSANATALPNDPTPGSVDDTDFDYWRAHFGETIGGGSGSLATGVAVPEPSSLALLCMAIGGLAATARTFLKV